jgi:epsilon-lactone hydrolase
VLGALTLIGMVINRFSPDILQRVLPPEADLHGLGPFLLQVGTHEMLLNDTILFADRLRAQNIEVWVQQWHKAMHMFQLSFDVNPDARRAVDEVAAFIRYATTVQDEISA